MLLRISKRLWLAPGIDPLTRIRFCSGRTSTISRFCWVTRALPIWPGIFLPRRTRDGQALQPIEPGARWNFEPCVARPPENPQRLTTPLVRKDDRLVPASWDEALDRTVLALKQVKDTYGPDAIGVLASAKCTNEENYLLQKFARAVIGTNNIDHCARL